RRHLLDMRPTQGAGALRGYGRAATGPGAVRAARVRRGVVRLVSGHPVVFVLKGAPIQWPRPRSPEVGSWGPSPDPGLTAIELLLGSTPFRASGCTPAREERLAGPRPSPIVELPLDRKSTRLNSSHVSISYAVFCLKKKSKTS